jgi:hypothetical protein
LVSWEDHLDEKYGKIGSPKRDKYEEEFIKYKLGALNQEDFLSGTKIYSEKTGKTVSRKLIFKKLDLK